MNDKPVSPGKGSAPSQLEAIERLTRNLLDVVKALPGDKQDERLLQIALQFANIDFERLHRHFTETLAAPGQSLAAESHNINQLIKELENKDNKIHEFKISLADSVMENKGLQKQLQEAREKSDNLVSQVTQMQLHSKDLTLKLSTASVTIEARDGELETLKKELMDLRSRNYQLNNKIAEYEDQLQRVSHNLEQAQAAQTRMQQQNDRLKKDFEHVVTSNEMLKQELAAVEMCRQELEEAIESLQREKNHLQTRIDKLIQGSKKSVAYHLPEAKHESSSVLKPDEFNAFLPFCFPERLPSAIKFRREIKANWPDSLKPAKALSPSIFPSFATLKNTLPAPRKHFATPTMQPAIDRAIPLWQSNKKPFAEGLGHNTKIVSKKPEPSFTVRPRYTLKVPKQAAFIVSKDSRALKVFSNQRFMPRHIYTTSFSLYLAHLSECDTNLILKDTKILDFNCKKPEMIGNNSYPLKIANIFIEKLAFRHRFQLQSQKLLIPGPTFNCSFRRGSKLKSVLETFGNTISSMVQKYDIMTTPPAGNGRGVK